MTAVSQPWGPYWKFIETLTLEEVGMRHRIWYRPVLFLCNNCMNCRLYSHFVCNRRTYFTVWYHILHLFAWTLPSAGIKPHQRETSICCLSASVGDTPNRWLMKQTGGFVNIFLVSHHRVDELWHAGWKFFTCVNMPRQTVICTSHCWSATSRLLHHLSYFLFLTVLACLFNFLYVWRHKHGTQLLRGGNDHAAEGVQAVHQADVDPRQRNISGFFLPLWILL